MLTQSGKRGGGGRGGGGGGGEGETDEQADGET